MNRLRHRPRYQTSQLLRTKERNCFNIENNHRKPCNDPSRTEGLRSRFEVRNRAVESIENVGFPLREPCAQVKSLLMTSTITPPNR